MRAIFSDICSFGQRDVVAEFEAGAAFGDVADHAVPRRAGFVDLGDAAINHLVACALRVDRASKIPR